ncbi:MAG: hypothetical protein H7Z42_19425, partial [Roseiflexaceae bacterium]|nr:hypothetical protein [Roseiflexaceae bacterium]
PVQLAWIAGLFACAGVFFVAGVSILTVVSFTSIQSAQQIASDLDQNGVIAQGLIIDHWHDSSNDTTIYYLAYQYGGSAIKQSVRWWTYRTRRIGEHVNVRYLASNPLMARLEDIR